MPRSTVAIGWARSKLEIVPGRQARCRRKGPKLLQAGVMCWSLGVEQSQRLVPSQHAAARPAVCTEELGGGVSWTEGSGERRPSGVLTVHHQKL